MSKPHPKVTEARVVSETVHVSAQRAYDYARQMENLPHWASGLASGIEHDQQRDVWFTDSPMGRVPVAMAPRNDFGVLDHDVTLPHGGPTIHNAFRVTPAGTDACVFTFVVLRLEGTDQQAFDTDVDHVTRDLAALKKVLEGHAGQR